MNFHAAIRHESRLPRHANLNNVVVVDVNNLKNGKEPVKLQKESPARCDGEGKQSKGNWEMRKGRFKD